MLNFLKYLSPENLKYMTHLRDLRMESPFPGWIFPFIAAGLILLAFYSYKKNSKINKKQYFILSSLRSPAYLIMLFIVSLPILKIIGEGAPPGPVPIIIDGTESMLIKDTPAGSRFAQSMELLENIKKNNPADELLNLKIYFAGDNFQKIEDNEKIIPDKNSTSVSEMLDKGIKQHLGSYIPGIVLLSDGAHNSPDLIENTTKLMAERNIPVYTVGLGKETAKDLSVKRILGENVAFKDEKAKLFIDIQQNGYSSSPVTVKLKLGEDEVYRADHIVNESGELSVPVEYEPEKTGTFKLTAEVEPLADEITAENNKLVKSIRIIDEKIRILLVFGQPSWEFRYLVGVLERDKRVKFNACVVSIDPRILRNKNEEAHFISAEKLPKSSEQLHKKYDIVFISKVDIARLPDSFVNSIPDFVENSGALAVLSDPYLIPYSMKNTVLEKLLPLTVPRGIGRSYRDEIFSPQKIPMNFEITEDGQTNQLVIFSSNKNENKKIWNELPPVYNCYSEGRLKPSAISLLMTLKSGSNHEIPAIIHHSYGKGSVLFLAFDSTWRWRKEYGNRYFRDFWGKAVQFLGLPHLLDEAAQSVIFVGKENCSVDEPVSIRAKISNPDYSPYLGESVNLTIKSNEDKEKIKMNYVKGRPGMFECEYIPQKQGGITLELPEKFSANPVELRAVNKRLEFRNPAMNKTILNKIAENTAGKSVDCSDSGKILEQILKNRTMKLMKTKISLWDRWFVFVLLIIILSTEWIFRKLYCLD